MIDDGAGHVIVFRHADHFKVFDCTLENAKRMLTLCLDNLDEDAEAASQMLALPVEQRPVWVEETLIGGAFEEVLHRGQGGTGTRDLRVLLYGKAPSEGRPELVESDEEVQTRLVVSQSMVDELVLWAYKNKIEVPRIPDLSARRLNALMPHESLSFLAPLRERVARPLRYISRENLRVAKDLRQLQHGQWKEEAKLTRVVQRYLSFIEQELSNRDESVSLVMAQERVDDLPGHG